MSCWEKKIQLPTIFIYIIFANSNDNITKTWLEGTDCIVVRILLPSQSFYHNFWSTTPIKLILILFEI